MKAKQQTRNEKKKPLRKLPDLAVKKDVRGGENVLFVFAKPAVEYKP